LPFIRCILLVSGSGPRDRIAAEGSVNQEQMVIADVDLNLLEEQGINGTAQQPRPLHRAITLCRDGFPLPRFAPRLLAILVSTSDPI
jgi:hypothetical protein